LKVSTVDGFCAIAVLPSPWAVAAANSGRNRQALDRPMIQVEATLPGRLPDSATIKRRDGRQTGPANLLADILTSRTTGNTHIVDDDWNRNSQAMRLKPSTL
jgi:hypothetical protein